MREKREGKREREREIVVTVEGLCNMRATLDGAGDGDDRSRLYKLELTNYHPPPAGRIQEAAS